MKLLYIAFGVGLIYLAGSLISIADMLEKRGEYKDGAKLFWGAIALAAWACNLIG